MLIAKIVFLTSTFCVSSQLRVCLAKMLKHALRKGAVQKNALECAELNKFHEQKMRNEYLYTTVGVSTEGKLAP